MKPVYLNLFATDPGSALLEDCRAGDESIELTLGEQEAKVVHSLLAVESYLISRALAALVTAGVRVPDGDARRKLTA